MKTFDLILSYYDKPEILYNWFYRLINFSDFEKFIDRSNVIIADSGTLLNNIQSSFKIVEQLPEKYRKKVIYGRVETTETRKKVPEGIDPRTMCHSYNMAALEISKADVIITSVIGQVFSPKYFEGHVKEHIKDEKALVLPKRFDLLINDYHSKHYTSSWDTITKFPLQYSGGWPDASIRRKWIQEVGGWDENYITISPVDMDMGSRLSGKLDNGMNSEWLFPDKGYYNNLGLNFHQPFDIFEICSLTCNTYNGHIDKEDNRRQKGYEMGLKYYLENWGVIKRNVNKKLTHYDTWKF